MVKKKNKNKDFQKPKLKVGKRLPRKDHFTDTSFSTKKIEVAPQTGLLGDKPTLNELFRAINHVNVGAKKDALNKLCNYVMDRDQCNVATFPDIMGKLLNKTLVDNNGEVRAAGIKVIEVCISLQRELEFLSFFPTLKLSIKTLMTHPSKEIKRDSLKYLDVLLELYPDITCQEPDLLEGMLNMISHSTMKPKSKLVTRELIDYISSKTFSPDWVFQVLKRTLPFLTAFARDKEEISELDDGEEAKQVHWDGKSPLYLPLYVQGGLRPLPLNYPQLLEDVAKCDTRDGLESMCCFVGLLQQVIKGEFSSSSKCVEESKLFHSSAINHLNIVVDILGLLSSWLKSKAEKDDPLVTSAITTLKNILYDDLMKHFPYNQQVSKSSPDTPDCLRLNLAVCYLYSTFDGLKKIDQTVFEFLKIQLLASTELEPESLKLMLKACKNFFQPEKNINKDIINCIICGLCGILDANSLSSWVVPIVNFFMEVTLAYEFKSLTDQNSMATWFKVILNELQHMKDRNVFSSKILRYIRKISARKYRHVVAFLKAVPAQNMLSYLQCENEEFKTTIMQLIVDYKYITGEVLEDISNMIYQEELSPSTTCKLIQHFADRIFDRFETPDQDKMEFLRFLLNVGFDTATIIESSMGRVDNAHVHPCVAGLHFELFFDVKKFLGYSPITQICLKYICNYTVVDFAETCVDAFLQSVIGSYNKYPVHSLLLLFTLAKKYRCVTENKYLNPAYTSLKISATLLIKAIAKENPDEETIEALSELIKTFDMDADDVVYFMRYFTHHYEGLSDCALMHGMESLESLLMAETHRPTYQPGIFSSEMGRFLETFHHRCQPARSDDPDPPSQMNPLEEMFLKLCNIFSNM